MAGACLGAGGHYYSAVVILSRRGDEPALAKMALGLIKKVEAAISRPQPVSSDYSGRLAGLSYGARKTWTVSQKPLPLRHCLALEFFEQSGPPLSVVLSEVVSVWPR